MDPCLGLLKSGLDAARFQPRRFFDWRGQLREHTSIHAIKARSGMAANGFVVQPTPPTRVTGVARRGPWSACLTFECQDVLKDKCVECVNTYTLTIWREGGAAAPDVVVRMAQNRQRATVVFGPRLSRGQQLVIRAHAASYVDLS